jgi:tryptophan halogenase
LINQTLQEPFIFFKDALFCDRAIAMNIPTDDARCGINPYTTSTALQAGWVWHTPLFGRSGNGYVYCSDFISPTAAEAEFRAYLGDVAVDLEVRHIEMRTGHHRQLWVNNCVSLGLAGGFVEPLESTGIFLIEMALHHLVQNFPDKQFQSALINRYNRLMTYYYEEVRDFLVLHYCTTRRVDTPFWQVNHHHAAIPPSLQHRLAQWRTVLPNAEDALEFGPMRDFLPYACTSILAGTEYLPDQPLPLLAYQSDQATQTLTAIQTKADHLTQTLPDHYEYLRQLHLYNALRVAYLQDQ